MVTVAGVLGLANTIVGLAAKVGKALAREPVERAVTRSLARSFAEFKVKPEFQESIEFALTRDSKAAVELAKLVISPHDEPDTESLADALVNDGLDLTTLPGFNLTDFLDKWVELFADACFQETELHRFLEHRIPAGRPFQTVHAAKEKLFAHYRDRLNRLPALGLFIATETAIARTRVTLDKVYVPFTAARGRAEVTPAEVKEVERIEQDLKSDRLSESRQRELKALLDLKRADATLASSAPVNLKDLFGLGSRVVITGEPGSGKSTLLRYLAVRFATDNYQELLGLTEPMFPIILSIGHYAKEQNRKPGLSPLDYLAEHYHAHSLDDIDRLFRSRLAQGNCLVMFDGMDEVIDSVQRRAVLGIVESFVREHDHSGNRFLVTSRIAGYEEAALGSDFTRLTVLPFDDEQIPEFLTNWCVAFETLDGETPQRRKQGEDVAQAIWAMIRGTPAIKRLAVNPLMLTILSIIRYQRVQLPHRRVELYREYLKLFAEAWHRARDIADMEIKLQVEDVQIDEDMVVTSLGPVAYDIHRYSSGGVIDRTVLKQSLTRYFQDTCGKPQGPAASAAEALIRIVVQQIGLLAERGTGLFGFVHPTFEEYVVARHLADQTPEDCWNLIEPVLHAPRWREVILLTIGSLRGRNVDALLEKILSRGSEFEEVLKRDLLLADSILADDIKVVSAQLRNDILVRLVELGLKTRYGSQQRTAADILTRMNGTICESRVRGQLGAVMNRQLEKTPDWVCRVLGAFEFEDQTVTAALLKLLEHKDSDVRGRAAQALANLRVKDQPVIAALLKLLEHKDSDVRGRAARALGKLQVEDRPVIAALLKLLEDKEWYACAGAAEALGRLQVKDQPVIAALLKLLEDKEWCARAGAAEALGRLQVKDRPVIAALLKLLEHKEWYACAGAAEALGRLQVKDQPVIAALLKLLEDKEWYACAGAAKALGRLQVKDQPVIAALLKLLEHKEGYARVSAAEALVNLHVKDQPVIAALLKLLEDREWYVRSDAARALGKLQVEDQPIIAALLKLLEDENSYVRAGAAEALGHLQVKDQPVIDAMLRLQEDKDSYVRGSAAQALADLGVFTDCVISALRTALDKHGDDDSIYSALAVLVAKRDDDRSVSASATN
jgi:HEAT repeat protein/energy-coupling factor transporter ATP-binding protein EcfA2